jgi:hypothetical protein
MKKITIAALALLLLLRVTAATNGNGPEVKESLQQSFQKDFPNAENVHWGENNEGYNVTFTVKSILTRITYDKKGKFTGSLRNYSEQILPFYLTNKLKKKYPGQDIYGVTEITTPNDVTYFVKLQSDKYWTTVRLDPDGASEIVEQYGRDN